MQVVQVLFFGMFVVTSCSFHLRMRQRPTSRVLIGNLPWQLHLFVLYGGSVLILTRSVFRLIEYGMGNSGYLIAHEVFLYVFDGLLMFIMMCLFNWWHPSVINALLGNGVYMDHAIRPRKTVGGRISEELRVYRDDNENA